MRGTRGLPIAAYLGLMLALALAAAFVAVFSVVIWLPPRPPDVMRSDVVADHFQAGYDHMVATGRAMPDSEMVWSVQGDAPRGAEAAAMTATRLHLAHHLDLHLGQVRVAAAQIAHSDVLVFRVRDVEAMAEEAQQAVEDQVEAMADAAEMAREEGRTEEAVEIARQAERLAEQMQRRAEMHRRERDRSEHDASEHDASEHDASEHDASEHDAGEHDDEDSPYVGAFEFPAPVAPEAPEPPAAPEPPTPPTPPTPPIFAPAPPGVPLISGFEIGAQLPDGRWLVMRQGRNWEELGWIGRAALIIGGTLAVLSLLAVLFARRLTRPIRNFSDAVQAVGVNPQSEPVREEGPQELRSAAQAVNTMQARLRALIADRTKTLAAVAHDMRTPLMRLRLSAENAPPEQRDRMAKEIGEVEALVASFIAFARDDPAEEARVRLDLAALLQSIADDHNEAGRNVAYDGEERFIVTGQSLGLKRLFGNLVDNALKYGAAARIRLRREEGAAIVDVEDEGPGVPTQLREAVFEPFVRLGEGGGGAGLGLPAARSIARAHGGDIVILDAEKGALLRVTLPG